MNRYLFLLACIYSTGAIAGKDPQYPNTEGIQAEGTKAQLIEKGKDCIKANLKNDQFRFADDSIAAVFGLANQKALKKSDQSDPSALIDAFNESGKIFGKHTFVTKGFIATGIVTANVTIEAKDAKFRIVWNDAAYSTDMSNAWEQSLSPLIQEALPYKQAISILSGETDNLVACMLQAQEQSDW